MSARDLLGPVGSGRLRPWRSLAFLTAVAGVSAFFHLRSPNVPDPDSFYHIRHAALYRTNGIFMSEFPWIAASAVSRYASDIWYGFHLLLVPFTPIADPGLRIKLPGILLTCALLFAVHRVVRRHRIAAPSFWPFLLFFSAPNVLLHFTMMRPHMVTIALCAVLFSFLVEGGPVEILVVALALAFVHLSLFWMAPLIVLIVLGVKTFAEGRVEWRKAAASFLGLVAGWLLRPNPLGAAKIVRVQTFDLMKEKLSGVPLLVGTELQPITGTIFAGYFVPFLIFWGVAIVVTIAALANGSARRLEPRARTFMASSLVLSVAFFLMMFFVARRSFAGWTLFGTLFVGAVHTAWLGGTIRALPRRQRNVEDNDVPLSGAPARRIAGAAASSDSSNRSQPAASTPSHVRRMRIAILTAEAVLFLVMVVHAVIRNRQHLENAFDPREFAEAGAWLESHSRPGEIVYNVHWDSFPKLFLWDQKNVYVSGMDPIFQYVVDPSLYYKSFYLYIGKATAFTCGAPTCTQETLEGTYTVLTRDFHASWLVIEKERSPALYAYVRSDPRFVPAFENRRHAVFDLEGTGRSG